MIPLESENQRKGIKRVSKRVEVSVTDLTWSRMDQLPLHVLREILLKAKLPFVKLFQWRLVNSPFNWLLEETAYKQMKSVRKVIITDRQDVMEEDGQVVLPPRVLKDGLHIFDSMENLEHVLIQIENPQDYDLDINDFFWDIPCVITIVK